MEQEQEKLNQEQQPQQAPEQNNESSREGYHRPTYQREYRANGTRPQRPRIHTGRTYNNSNNEEGAFRPEGFGAGLTSGQPRPYRPRYNEGGYQPRQQGGYNPEGGYQPRSYGQPRQQGGYNRDDSYQPRPHASYSREGGYQPRSQSGYNREGGYQPRPYGQPRQQGGYNREGGYQPRTYGQPRQQGGYNQGYNQGGYNQGGYGPRPYGPQKPRKRPNGPYDPQAKYSMKKRIEYREDNIDPNEPIRLNKFLANAGVCSRREADDFITAGAVAVNGTVVTELGTKVQRTDSVTFHDQPVTLEKKVYILLNKPKDCVTTSDDPEQRKTVLDIVKGVCPERIYPVGRLDRNTTGVLLLTNDGDLASKLTHPKFLKKKVYHVYLDKAVTQHDLQQIVDGIELEDGEIHADAAEYANPTDKHQVGIEIHSGKNRIVRRIFEHLGYRVTKLDRVQFAGLTKKNVRRGDWRFLTEKEVEMLRMGAFE